MDGEQPTYDCPGCQRWAREVAALKAQVTELTAALEAERRGGKRQAAPFRRPGGPKARPRKPGRKAGDEHGRHAHRQAPPPEAIHETYDVPVPVACPHCQSTDVTATATVVQYQTEIPRQPIQRQFRVQVGRCGACGRRLRGRHPLQTSNAVGAAAAQLGPDAHAAMAVLQKDLGLAHGKVARIFAELFGIRVARATSARSLERTARRCRAACVQIRQDIRGSPQLTPDETGWRVGGRNAWWHVVVSGDATLYQIARHRGHEPLAAVLGPNWCGVVTRDGWAPYDQLTSACHQQCLAHLLRRGAELAHTAVGVARRFPLRIAALLGSALRLRDRVVAGSVSPRGLASAWGRLERQLDAALAGTKRHAANERFARHLRKHRAELFVFLTQPGVIDATNYRAEQALRPAVVNRKVWGGNRTWRGAWVQGILNAVLRTSWQRGLHALTWLHAALCSTTPALLPSR